MNYKKFTVTDFICDEYFQNSIIQPDEQKNKFWNRWIEENPGKKETIEQAKKVLLNIQFREDIPTPEQVQNALTRHLEEINTVQEVDVRAKITSISRFRKWRKIAAIFIGVILIGASVIYYNWKTAVTTVSTNYGELKSLELPDGTMVTLNAHSSVTYLKHWRSNSPRKIQLQGEAFFEVKHLNKNEAKVKNSERFIVSTKDLNVEVLGTAFDVKSRRGNTDVVLKTGKVKVAFNDKRHPDIVMLPGEMVAYEVQTELIKKSRVDADVQTAWLNKKLILNNASLKNIIQYLEDNYGYKIILKDTAIGNRKMEGTLLLDNLDDIIFVLSTSLDIKVEKKDSTLIFSR